MVYPMKLAGEGRSWSDYDKSAMKTPWGPAQHGYQLATGVWWFGTAGHGGLMVRPAVAAKKLSGAARKMGWLWGGSFWYEEDVAYTIPFYENPEWAKVMTAKAGGTNSTPEQLERTIRHYFPRYFDLLRDNVQVPRLPKVGDTLEFKVSVRYSGYRVFVPGDVVTVVKVTPSMIVFQSEDSSMKYKIQSRYVYDGKLVKKAAKLAAYNALGLQPYLPKAPQTVMWVLRKVTDLTRWAEFFYVAFKFVVRDTTLATRFKRFATLIGVEDFERPTPGKPYSYFNPSMYAEQRKRLGVDPKIVLAVAVAVLVKLGEKTVASKLVAAFRDFLPAEGEFPAAAAAPKKPTPTQMVMATITPEIQALASKVWDALGNNPEAAKAFSAELAEDVNWHSLRIPVMDWGYPAIKPSYSDVAQQLDWAETDTAAFIVALLLLAGDKRTAQTVVRQALEEFADYYQADGGLARTSKQNKTSSSTGYDVLMSLFGSYREVEKAYEIIEDADPQAGALFNDVLSKLADALSLPQNQLLALGRIKGVVENVNQWNPALLRNNIFKAADLMGMRLPSAMFASRNKRPKINTVK